MYGWDLEDLFYDVRRKQEPKIGELTSSDILIEKNEAAIKQLKKGKTSGSNQIHSEFIRLIYDKKIRWITVIFNSVYKSGIIHKNWMKSELNVSSKKSC